MNGSHGVLLTIGGITFSKCRLSFETPAPNHTSTIRSFAATIMSTNGKKAKKISAGSHCSLRAAKKIVLSRSPTITSRAIAGITAAAGRRPALSPRAPATAASSVPGTTSATASASSSAA